MWAFFHFLLLALAAVLAIAIGSVAGVGIFGILLLFIVPYLLVAAVFESLRASTETIAESKCNKGLLALMLGIFIGANLGDDD